MNTINQFGQQQSDLFELHEADSLKLHGTDFKRRRTLKDLFMLTGKLAFSAIPLGISAVFSKSYGQSEPSETTGIRINHLILIEYLLNEFFITAAANSVDQLASNHITALKMIAWQDKQHIEILKRRLIPLKVQAIEKPDFDFTGGGGSGNGPYKDVFTDTRILGSVARAIKDMAVRAYIAQYKYLMPADRSGPVNIPPVESRHAAHLRSMPFGYGFEQPWITGNTTIAPFQELASVYAGEENTIQDGIQIVNINGQAINIDQATEAFDEPLSFEKVNAILEQFIVK